MFIRLLSYSRIFLFFFFNDTATTEIYTLSLHDALPISTASRSTLWRSACRCCGRARGRTGAMGAHARRKVPLALCRGARRGPRLVLEGRWEDRKSTRLNSSHANISYAVFCLKKKKKNRV